MENKSCSTDVRVDKVNFTWTINNFSFHRIKGGFLKSSEFSSVSNDEFEWYLRLCFENNEIMLALFLSKRSKRNKVFVKYSFSVSNKRKQLEQVYDDIVEFEKSHGVESSLFDEKFKFQDYLINDKLIITCKMELSEMNDIKTSNRRRPKVSECHLSSDLGLLWTSQEFADVILSVKNKDFPAHKSILAARSPVFAAMFRHKMTETKENRVVINDINEEVMGEMLKYMYTDRCENMDKLALELMVAADKYALDQLRTLCGDVLGCSLTVENAADVLLMSDLHHANYLKSEAIKFIVSKFAEVLNTKAWKNILLSQPELANEVCLAVARR
ncbi:speckle-type POZ protein-like [Planococcus citri]|uniref:speckle-type POZ protein-like n=1 Tax=Planococcus citri TaxID=170843 RepID=UPI0031F810CB